MQNRRKLFRDFLVSQSLLFRDDLLAELGHIGVSALLDRAEESFEDRRIHPSFSPGENECQLRRGSNHARTNGDDETEMSNGTQDLSDQRSVGLLLRDIGRRTR
jgi:hypothetical protein